MRDASFRRALVGAVLTVLGAGAAWTVLRPTSPPTQQPQRPAATSVEPAPPSAEPEPAGYRGTPAVSSYGLGDAGPYLTLVRFPKTAGAWPAGQTSRFDLWFDGDVEQELEGRGFGSPVQYDVKIPEPRHIAISVTTAPLDAATYVAFTIKSARPVSLVRSDVSPKLGAPIAPAAHSTK